MQVLQVEMMMEASREEKLAKVTDPDERVQLEEVRRPRTARSEATS